MHDDRPHIWFERDLLPELAADVRARVHVLGPGVPGDPYAGLRDAVGAVVGVLPFDAGTFDLAPHLLAVGRTGIGYDSVDVAAATARGIAVVNAPTGPTISTAEQAVALILTVAKSVRISSDRLAAGEDELYSRHRAIELRGASLGLVGFGRIARHVAGIATGFGMQVATYDPYVTDDSVPVDIRRCDHLADLLGSVDVVSVHIPLTDDTAHMFDDATFAQMRPGAIFVNTARGGLVDQDALIRALDSGHLFGAAVDVTTPEPLPTDHPMLGRPDLIVTPHVATGTPTARRANFSIAFDQVVQVATASRPTHLVNPDVWDRVLDRIEEQRT